MKKIECPVRPGVPSLLVVAVALWLSCACVYWFVRGIGQLSCLAIAGVGTLGAIAAAVACYRLRGHALALVAMGVCLGVLLGAVGGVQMHATAVDAKAAGGKPKTYRVVSDPSEGDFGASCFAEVQLPSGRRATVRVNLPDNADVSCWSVFEASGSLTLPNENASGYLWSRGAVGSVSPYRITLREPQSFIGMIGQIRERCSALFPTTGEGAALMRSILFGDRRELFTLPLYGDIKAIGLAHIVAVSGAHLAVIAGLATFFLRILRVPRAISIAVLSVFVCLYVVFTGAPKSAIRAAFMIVCALLAFFGKRRANALSALALVVIALIAQDSTVSLSTSFALSAASTLGIIVFGRYCAAWLQELAGVRAPAIADPLGITLAANGATIGISVSLFGQLPLISPAANLLIAPLFALLCMAGTMGVALCLVLPVLTGPVIGALCAAGDLLCVLAHLLAGVPFACVPATANLPAALAVTIVAFAILWYAWPRPRRVLGGAIAAMGVVVILAVIVVMPQTHGNEIVMLDVGQGDALLIRTGSRALLVDTGTNDSQVLTGLARHDVRKLDAVLITHPDDDHCGSLRALLDAMPVDRVLVAADLLTSENENCVDLRADIAGEKVVGLRAGDEFALGSYAMRVLSPEAYHDDGGNADSIVMSVACDVDRNGGADVTALFTGDAEAEVLAPLAQAGVLGPIDILKVPHHGSRAGVDDALLAVLQPRIALISVGANNRYGHPRQEVLDALAAAHVRAYRTDEQGDVVCALSAEGITVRTQR